MKSDVSYLSKDNITEIHAIEWSCDKEPIAIVQIAHGMVEFIDRYDRFARYLNQQGILVVGNDHLGHGQSVSHPEKLGYFAEKNGNRCLIEDMFTLFSRTKIKYPHMPYFLLGHSMGSFLARQYIEIYGDQLDGAIIMGTGDFSQNLVTAAKSLAQLVAKTRGDTYRSTILANLVLGSNNNAFEPARTRNDWLTKDEAIVDAYNENPLNNFLFTANGYINMFEGLDYAINHVDAVPKDLPILVVSGAMDPVGNFGLGPKAVYDSYLDHGIVDVQLRLYENDRHEILNETNYQQVYRDLAAWIQDHIPPKQ
ncbi:MAG: alpha/beta fold hydrolase [Erysipelotrichaceae bacterium]|nr:alpha/beta fold hydrolase [Erysipelotrichaceae bacterium]